MTLSAFGGNEKLRARWLADLEWHQAQDMILQGSYGEGDGKAWRGCSVGCSRRALNKARRLPRGGGGSGHAEHAADLGVPAELSTLASGRCDLARPSRLALTCQACGRDSRSGC